jgi:hypothetical protein
MVYREDNILFIDIMLLKPGLLENLLHNSKKANQSKDIDTLKRPCKVLHLKLRISNSKKKAYSRSTDRADPKTQNCVSKSRIWDNHPSSQ